MTTMLVYKNITPLLKCNSCVYGRESEKEREREREREREMEDYYD